MTSAINLGKVDLTLLAGKRIFITGKMHCDTNSIPTKFSQTQDTVQDKENI